MGDCHHQNRIPADDSAVSVPRVMVELAQSSTYAIGLLDAICSLRTYLVSGHSGVRR